MREIAGAADLPKGQIVISDGLNAIAITDQGHLEPYLEELHKRLTAAGIPSDENIVVTAEG